MSPDSLVAIQAELAGIKALLALAVYAGGVVLVLVTIRACVGLYADVKRLMAKQFENQAENLLREDKLGELKRLAREQLDCEPNHEYARWYLARALYLDGDHDGARCEFIELERRCPSWKGDHIDPYLRAIEQRCQGVDAK